MPDLVEVITVLIGLLVYAMFSFCIADTKRPSLVLTLVLATVKYLVVYICAREILKICGFTFCVLNKIK